MESFKDSSFYSDFILIMKLSPSITNLLRFFNSEKHFLQCSFLFDGLQYSFSFLCFSLLRPCILSCFQPSLPDFESKFFLEVMFTITSILVFHTNNFSFKLLNSLLMNCLHFAQIVARLHDHGAFPTSEGVLQLIGVESPVVLADKTLLTV